MSTLATRLQVSLAEKAGATQADLARHCDVAGPSVSNWFTGETKKLKADSLRLAAEFLGVNRDWLETGKGPKSELAGTMPSDRAANTPGQLHRLLQQFGEQLSQMDPANREELGALLNAWATSGGKLGYIPMVADCIQAKRHRNAA